MQSNEEIKNKTEWFAGLMEDVLRRNAHKNGWSECSLLWLQAKLTEEVGELGRILAKELHTPEGKYVSIGDANTNPVLRAALFEAVDVANIALMIADLLSSGEVGGEKWTG
jgi:NTP pyrophosphatase (non-canonical NTP hydrolase)